MHVSRSALRVSAGVFLVIYLAWNAFWLSGGDLPPSLMMGVFGLPCPTTGCTRSLECMLAGRWLESILYNPFTLPIGLLFAGSLAVVAVRAVRRERVVLPAAFGWMWLGLLTAAWACKLAGPTEYW